MIVDGKAIAEKLYVLIQKEREQFAAWFKAKQ